jgi:hypothetical protein
MFFVLYVMRRSSKLLVSEVTTIWITIGIATAAILLAVNVPIASAQQLTGIPPAIENGTFHNVQDGIRLKMPDGWVVQDIDNFHLPNFAIADEDGFLLYAVICPQQEAVLGNVGRLYSCEQSSNSVKILYDRLGHRPEFEVVEDPLDITLDDFLAFMTEKMQERGYTNITVVNATDISINVTSPEDSNTTISAVPAKQVEITYQPGTGLPQMSSFSILATIPEPPQPGLRQTLSGYSVTYQAPAASISMGNNPPAPVQQIFRSLEFIRTSK